MERGVGQCPERPEGFGHVWAGAIASGDSSNPCRFCEESGRAYFAAATRARAAGFDNYERPSEEEREATAARIVADKKRRDAEAVANGTARPGQIAGAPKRGRS
jgi:predicted  nucleic acid-binding Zn-ribbon protein